MSKKCLLVNISGFHGRPRIQRRKIKVGNTYKRIRAGNVLEVTPAMIEAYPEKDELTESVNPKDWTKDHIFLVIPFEEEQKGEATKKVEKALGKKKDEKKTEKKDDKKETKKEEDAPPQLEDSSPEDEPEDESDDEPDEFTNEYVHEHPTYENFMRLGTKGIHKYKLEYHVSIKGYNSMSLEDKAKFLADNAKK